MAWRAVGVLRPPRGACGAGTLPGVQRSCSRLWLTEEPVEMSGSEGAVDLFGRCGLQPLQVMLR